MPTWGSLSAERENPWYSQLYTARVTLDDFEIFWCDIHVGRLRYSLSAQNVWRVHGLLVLFLSRNDTKGIQPSPPLHFQSTSSETSCINDNCQPFLHAYIDSFFRVLSVSLISSQALVEDGRDFGSRVRSLGLQCTRMKMNSLIVWWQFWKTQLLNAIDSYLDYEDYEGHSKYEESPGNRVFVCLRTKGATLSKDSSPANR